MQHVPASFANHTRSDFGTVADGLDDPRDVFITGQAGRGKSTLAYALASEWGLAFIGKHSGEIMESIKATYDDGGHATEHEMRRYERCGLLLIDDFGATQQTGHNLAAILQIISAREESGLPTIVTSNLNLKQISQQMDSRFASRFLGYRIVTLDGPDRRSSRDGEIPKADVVRKAKIYAHSVRCFDCHSRFCVQTTSESIGEYVCSTCSAIKASDTARSMSQ